MRSPVHAVKSATAVVVFFVTTLSISMAKTRNGIVDGRVVKMPYAQNNPSTKDNRLSDVQQRYACTNVKQDVKLHHLSRHPRDTSSLSGSPARNVSDVDTTSAPRNSLYFTGHELIKLAKSDKKYGGLVIPRHAFTVAFWLKPEGGQRDPLTVIGRSIFICILFQWQIKNIHFGGSNNMWPLRQNLYFGFLAYKQYFVIYLANIKGLAPLPLRSAVISINNVKVSLYLLA